MIEIQSPKAHNKEVWNIKILDFVLVSDFAFRIWFVAYDAAVRNG